MTVSIQSMQAKYQVRFEISKSDKGWLRIKELNPLGDNYPAAQRPAFLDYNVEVSDPRFSDTLDDRSRNVWLRNSQGRGIQSVSYSSGMGIWQVSQDGEPMAFSDLNSGSQEMVAEWLNTMDAYVSKSIPELEQLIKQRNN